MGAAAWGLSGMGTLGDGQPRKSFCGVLSDIRLRFTSSPCPVDNSFEAVILDDQPGCADRGGGVQATSGTSAIKSEDQLCMLKYGFGYGFGSWDWILEPGLQESDGDFAERVWFSRTGSGYQELDLDC